MGTSVHNEEILAGVRVVRQLGTRLPATHLAEGEDSSKVVLETYAGVTGGFAPPTPEESPAPLRSALLDAKTLERVSESAKQLCGLRHPHLVTVLSVEKIRDAWSIATDHVDGLPLEDVFFGMSMGARLRAVVDVLTALSALHQLAPPIVHRGVLLRCAFVEKTGRTKLGFAYRGLDSCAPEGLLGDDTAIDARTDVYGAGVMLWEAVTGHSLFGADTRVEVLKKQLAGRIEKALPPARDRWVRAVLPVIERALATDPTARYATIAEMAAALRIGVRARLMIHEDVIEELWPAETKPTVTSGIQRAAEEHAPPAPASAAPQLVSEMKIAISTPEPVVAPHPPAPAPQRQRRTPNVVVASVVALAVALIVVACLVRLRTHAVTAHADAMPERLVTQPLPAVRALIEAPAASSTEPAPTVTPTHTGHKPVNHPKTHVYDPSSI